MMAHVAGSLRRTCPDLGFHHAVLQRMCPHQAIFRARLTECGLAIADTVQLCSEYAKIRSWDEVRRFALRDNVLGKGSEARITKLVRAVERRVINARPPLSRPELLARFL